MAYRDQNTPDNTEHTSERPGKVRRAIAKVKNSTGLGHDSKANYVDYQDDRPHPHPKVEDLANTVGYSLIQEVMQYMKGPDGEEAMEIIFSTQSRVAARLALADEAKHAARIASQEAVTGSYDAVERKSQELFKKLPPSLWTTGSILLGSYVLLLSVGMLFSLWRFALFGLQ